MKTQNLKKGMEIAYVDEFTNELKKGIIQEVLSIQVVLTDGKFVFNKNIRQTNEGITNE